MEDGSEGHGVGCSAELDGALVCRPLHTLQLSVVRDNQFKTRRWPEQEIVGTNTPHDTCEYSGHIFVVVPRPRTKCIVKYLFLACRHCLVCVRRYASITTGKVI